MLSENFDFVTSEKVHGCQSSMIIEIQIMNVYQTTRRFKGESHVTTNLVFNFEHFADYANGCLEFIFKLNDANASKSKPF